MIMKIFQQPPDLWVAWTYSDEAINKYTFQQLPAYRAAWTVEANLFVVFPFY